MMTRHRMTNWIGMICAAVLLFGFAQTAAAVTSPNTTINNKATVTYQVGGMDRSATHEVSFLVDKKIDLSVTSMDGDAYVSVPLPWTTQHLTFKVANEGNDTQDFVLSTNPGTNPVEASPSTFEAPVSIVVDDGDMTYEDGVDTATFIDELAPGEFVYVYVLGNIPLQISGVDVQEGDISAISLIAAAHAGGNADTEGVNETDLKQADDPNVVQVVWADGDGDQDIIVDGKHSDTGAFKVQSAVLTVEKTWAITYDGMLIPEANQRPIPGATITYTITVTNTGSLPVTGASVLDDLTGKIGVTIDWKGNLTTSVGTANWDGSKVTVTGINLNGGGAQAFISFDVTIL